MIRKLRVALIWVALLTVSGTLSGCLSFFNHGNGIFSNKDAGFTKSEKANNKVVLKDTVLAIGLPNAHAKGQIDEQVSAVLFGQKQSYLLTVGGDKLSIIAKGFAQHSELKAKQLSISTANTSCRLYLDDQTSWGCVQFNYPATVVPEEVNALTSSGFNFDSQTQQFSAQIQIMAAVKPALDFSKLDVPVFQKPRQLAFYETDDNTPYVDKPRWGRILRAPFALAVDIATFPFQLLFLGAILAE